MWQGDKWISSEVKRTRTFEPDDVRVRSQEEVEQRLRELREKREAFDENVYFTGLSRLGSRYTMAEPLVMIDGERKKGSFIRESRGAVSLMVGVGLTLVFYGAKRNGVIRNNTIFRTLVPLGLSAPFLYYFTPKMNDYFAIEPRMEYERRLLYYAVLKEDELPVIERKKYGEIIQDWFSIRSLNTFSKEKWVFLDDILNFRWLKKE